MIRWADLNTVTWKQLAIPSDDELAQFSLDNKVRFLVDENLGETVANWLRQLGCNARTPSELGLRKSATDEEVFALAWREDRVLLTLDEDFLNDRQFPEHRNPGVIVLPDAPRNGAPFARALVAAIRVFGVKAIAYKSKTKVATNGEATHSSRNGGTGKIETTRYKLGTNNEVYEWEEA